MPVSKVTCLLPVYNAGRYLRQALDSVLAQSYQDFEIVAVDDGSTDDSLQILKECATRDTRVKVISRPNTGIVGALNDGLRECRGELVARMDADDVCLPDRLVRQVEFMAAHPDCVALGTDVFYTDPEGRRLIRHRPALEHAGILCQLLEGNGGALIHPSVMFRRSALDAVGGYRDRYQWIEDLDLYIRLAQIGTLANVPEVHLHYRQHLQSVNRTRERKENLRQEIVDAFRSAHQLPPLTQVGVREADKLTPADWRRHWAYDAARGGMWEAAHENARLALLAAPLDWRNWRCWRYIRNVRRQSAATCDGGCE